MNKTENSHVIGLKSEISNIALRNRKMIIYGTGHSGQTTLELFCKYKLDENILAFCDSDKKKWGKGILGLNILSYDEIKNRYSDVLFLVASDWWREIKQYLIEHGEKESNIYILSKNHYFAREFVSYILGNDTNEKLTDYNIWYNSIDKLNFNKNIENLKQILDDKESLEIFESRIKLAQTGDWKYFDKIDFAKEQYFLDEIFEFSNDEMFVDIGAYDGDTILKFVRTVNNKYSKIIAFEPDSQSYKKLNRIILENDLKSISTFNNGIWNKKGKLNFNAIGKIQSAICDKGSNEIDVDTLDNILFDIPVTFIKMDIEGAEKEAIEGGKEIIKKYKPKLAICVYHKFEDMYEIPIMLKKLVPEYKIYFRCHVADLNEMVCYAHI